MATPSTPEFAEENHSASISIENSVVDTTGESVDLGGGSDSPTDGDDNAEERLARSRARNREHARRTRLRKKAQLEALQSKVKELQAESRLLRQAVEECSIASILLGLSSGKQDSITDAVVDLPTSQTSGTTELLATDVGGKRKRFLPDSPDSGPQPMALKIKGKTTLVGSGANNAGKTHINWKSGVYCDEDGVHQKLSAEELEALRRERNRMHAKKTRDRRKMYVSTAERTISELESENKKMREILAKQAKQHAMETSANPPVIPIEEERNVQMDVPPPQEKKLRTSFGFGVDGFVKTEIRPPQSNNKTPESTMAHAVLLSTLSVPHSFNIAG